MHTCTLANNIFDGSITNLLSILQILIEFLSPAHAKGRKSQNDFKFGTSIGHFQSDRAASMAEKGLSKSVKQCCDHDEQKRGAYCFIALEHSVLHGERRENSQRLVNGRV